MNGNNVFVTAMNGLGDSEQDAKVKQGVIPDAILNFLNIGAGYGKAKAFRGMQVLRL